MLIVAMPVGAGILALAPMPGHDNSYPEDLHHLRQWTPSLVISLATQQELANYSVQQLGADLQERGTRWVHLPLADMGVPDARFLEHWPRISRQARHALEGGGRVLLHCVAGCGRSGMVALRLMIESGEDPEPALTRLRLLRPCAIETDAQMRWAMSARRAMPQVTGSQGVMNANQGTTGR